MKAITVKQPYASLIVESIKDIENRTWKCPEKYIGERVLIHAGMKPDDMHVHFEFGVNTKKEFEMFSALVRADLKNLFGCIIGSVEIVGCVINHQSIWADKTNIPTVGDVLEDIHFLGKVIPPNPIIYNWVLANPVKFNRPIPCKGKLGFWDFEISDETLKEISR